MPQASLPSRPEDNAKSKGRFRIRVIGAGLSENGVFYSDQVLREATPLFDGARVFVKGDEEHLAGRGKDFRNLIGRLSEAAFIPGPSPDMGEIQATLELLDPAGETGVKLATAIDRNMTDIFGFSITAEGTARPVRRTNSKFRTAAASIDKVRSVDLIVEPAAKGGLINLIEARNTPMAKKAGTAADEDTAPEPEFLSTREIRTLVNATNLPAPAKAKLIEACAERTDLSEEGLNEMIRKERDYLAKFSESGTVKGLGADDIGRVPYGRVTLVEGRAQKVAKMLDAFLDPDDRSVISIRRCYVEATGDLAITGRLSDCDPVLLREALDSQSFGVVLGDAINRRMLQDYRDIGVYDVWRRIASTAPVKDFRTQHRTRVGGYGDLPTVAQGNAYLLLDSPDDEEATYAVAKRGGTEELTLEMIVNDDVGAVKQIPVKLSRSAKRTLCKLVMNMLRDNPQIYDGKNLFHADHGNLGTAALSGPAVAAGRLAMKAQQEAGSNEPIGIGPRFLLVPDVLEEAGVDLFRRNTNQDKTFLQSLSLDVLPVWCWTDPADWCLSADPNDIPTIEVGFLNGQEEPELFLADNPTAGSMFTHDKVTYKIRHIYGATALDYRGLYKSVVA